MDEPLTAVIAGGYWSFVITVSMRAYLPLHHGDRIAGSTLLLPFIWWTLFLYSTMAKSLLRVWSVFSVLLISHLGLIAWVLKGS